MYILLWSLSKNIVWLLIIFFPITVLFYSNFYSTGQDDFMQSHVSESFARKADWIYVLILLIWFLYNKSLRFPKFETATRYKNLKYKRSNKKLYFGLDPLIVVHFRRKYKMVNEFSELTRPISNIMNTFSFSNIILTT